MYDAILVHSFGGPEGPDDVVPFLENVTRGRGIPRERLAQVGEHYFLFGGKSPINDQNRALIAALRDELDRAGVDLPIFWGNRNWEPYLRDTVAEMVEAGHRRVLVLATSAFGSQSGCRQYREDLAEAAAAVDARHRVAQDPAVLDPPGLPRCHGGPAGRRPWPRSANVAPTPASSSPHTRSRRRGRPARPTWASCRPRPRT